MLGNKSGDFKHNLRLPLTPVKVLGEKDNH